MGQNAKRLLGQIREVPGHTLYVPLVTVNAVHRRYSDDVAWSVCLSVCLLRSRCAPVTLQKRINRSTRGLEEAFARWRCILAPAGEYDGSMCMATAMSKRVGMFILYR